jgi:hypothetical protein
MAARKPRSRGAWKSRIKKAMVQVGTWNASFDDAADTLADILERRDVALQEFLDEGGKATFEHISDRGAVNIKKNPRLQVWQDLNAQALAYWRDMGLTPAGLKKLNEAALKTEKAGSVLDEAVKAMVKELGGA